MKRKHRTEGQIIKILQVHEAGAPLAELAREHGIVDAEEAFCR